MTSVSKRVAAELEKAHAEALRLAEQNGAYVIRCLGTRMERNQDNEIVVRFEWEVGVPRG